MVVNVDKSGARSNSDCFGGGVHRNAFHSAYINNDARPVDQPA